MYGDVQLEAVGRSSLALRCRMPRAACLDSIQVYRAQEVHPRAETSTSTCSHDHLKQLCRQHRQSRSSVKI